MLPVVSRGNSAAPGPAPAMRAKGKPESGLSQRGGEAGPQPRMPPGGALALGPDRRPLREEGVDALLGVGRRRARRHHARREVIQEQQRNEGVTEIVDMPSRGHALTIDGGWREVADTALAFVKRFDSPSSQVKEAIDARTPAAQSAVGALAGH